MIRNQYDLKDTQTESMKGITRMKGESTRTTECSWRKMPLILAATLALLLLVAPVALADEMVTNGNFNGSTGWTLNTVTYTAGDSASSDGSGSLTLNSSGRNIQNTGSATLPVGIAAGSEIAAAADVVAFAKQQWAGASSTTQTVAISLRYADATIVEVYTATIPLAGAWNAEANATATVFPLTLAQNVDAVIIDLTTKCGNSSSATSDLFIDDVSITYSSPCSDGDPAVLSIQSPTEAQSIGGTFRVKLGVSGETDPASLTSVEFSIDGGGFAAAHGWDGSNWYYDWDTTAITGPQAATVAARATDTDCMNVATSPTRIVTIDNTGPSTTLNDCGGCHDYPPSDGNRDYSAGTVVGDHQAHSAYTCNYCHQVPPDESSANFAHRNRMIDTKSGNIGRADLSDDGLYSRGVSFAQSKAPTTGTCTLVDCHNNAVTPQWGVGTTSCSTCHTALPPTSGAHAAHYTAKGWPADTSNCSVCHPNNALGHSNVADSSVEVNLSLGYAGAGGSCSTPGGLGCHNDYATPAWSDGTVDCTSCHTAGGGHTADPASGLHAVTPSVSGKRHDQTLDAGGCSKCHAQTLTAHWDETFQGGDGQTTQMGLSSALYTQTADNTGSCSNTSCHLGESDAWAHQWNSTVGYYISSPSACGGCHGLLGSFNAGVEHNVGGIAGDHADDGTASNYGCETCHALEAATGNYDFTFGSADWANGGEISHHGNGKITMNDDAGGTITNWQRGTGGNSSKSMCLKCHTNWTDSAPQHWFTNTLWTPEEIAGDAVSAGHGVGAACTGCHDGQTQGARRNIGLEFDLARQHGSATPASADCEKCHDESSGPDGNIQLKVWDAAGTGYTTVTFDSGNLASANTHCISCHDTTRNVTIGGLSPPARSMANFTSTTTYNNHNFTTTGAVVPQKAKAISPHGNPGGNQMKSTESTVTTAMGCLHCHPSHGSATASKSATADAAGNAVNARMLGGLPSSAPGVGYDYASEGTLSDPNLCWACHDAKGVLDYYGDTTTGHWNGGTWKNPTFSYKTGKGGVSTLHIANKADGGTADDSSANIVCTTCHDVHGSPVVAQFYAPALKGKWLTSPYYEDRAPPSKSAGSNGLYAWPNANSSARSAADALSPRAEVISGTAWAPKEVGGGYGIVGTQNGAWGYFIDANTFGMSNYQPYASGAVTQKHMSDYDATAANISTFAGLCMTACHSAANIESRTSWTGHNPVVPGFGGSDAASDLFNVNSTTYPAGASRNQMVGQGWYNNTGWGQNLFAQDSPGERQGGDGGALDAKTYSHNKASSWGVDPTKSGAQAGYHQFPCSKCHTPHASELPALMRSNCLNTKHAGYEWRMAAEANNCHRVEDSGAPIIGPGDPYNGTTNGKQWNTVTPW